MYSPPTFPSPSRPNPLAMQLPAARTGTWPSGIGGGLSGEIGLSGGMLGRTRTLSGNEGLAFDPRTLDRLRERTRRDPQAGLREVAQQFEKIMLDMMLKSMRSASPQTNWSNNLAEQNAQDTFRSLHDQQLTAMLAQQAETRGGRGFGIAEMIVRQLGRFPSPDAAAGIDGKKAGSLNDEKMARFISALNGPTQRAAAQSGIAPHLLLAQAALESAWGQRPILTDVGENSHNLFGIKADAGWTGKSTETLTTEFLAGEPRQIFDRFRVYDDYDAAFHDYTQLLRRRYPAALDSQDDAQRFGHALQAGGYATDPRYADKIDRIARQLATSGLTSSRFPTTPPTGFARRAAAQTVGEPITQQADVIQRARAQIGQSADPLPLRTVGGVGSLQPAPIGAATPPARTRMQRDTLPLANGIPAEERGGRSGRAPSFAPSTRDIQPMGRVPLEPGDLDTLSYLRERARSERMRQKEWRELGPGGIAFEPLYKIRQLPISGMQAGRPRIDTRE